MECAAFILTLILSGPTDNAERTVTKETFSTREMCDAALLQHAATYGIKVARISCTAETRVCLPNKN